MIFMIKVPVMKDLSKVSFRFLLLLIFVNIGLLGCGSVNSTATVTSNSSDEQDLTEGDSSQSTSGDTTSTSSLIVQDKSFSTNSNQDLQINLSTLISNLNVTKDYTFTIVSPPNIGLIAMQNELMTYTPSDIGSDEIRYKVSDGSSDSNIGTITIVVSTVESSGGSVSVLVLSNKTITTMENEAVQFDISSMINEFDSTSSYNFAITSGPNIGSIKISGFTLTYTPDNDTTGNDQITLRAGDGNSTSNIATLNIQIQDPSTSAPKLQNVTYTIKPNVPAVLDLNLLFVAPHPFPGKTYVFTVLKDGKLGSGLISGTDLTYTPILNAFGTDTSLRVLVTDNLGQKAETPITVIISNN